MPRKSWFVQIYPVCGKPKAPVVFSDPEKVCAFIRELKKMGSHDTLAVYLTERATNKEERYFEELGVKLRLLS